MVQLVTAKFPNGLSWAGPGWLGWLLAGAGLGWQEALAAPLPSGDLHRVLIPSVLILYQTVTKVDAYPMTAVFFQKKYFQCSKLLISDARNVIILILKMTTFIGYALTRVLDFAKL